MKFITAFYLSRLISWKRHYQHILEHRSLLQQMVKFMGNILDRLLLFRLLPFRLLQFCCFVYSTFLLLFASICSIVIKFWFTKVLHGFFEVLGVFLQGTTTDIIWCTYTKIKVLAFPGSISLWDRKFWGYFFKDHPLTLTATWGRWGYCTHKMHVQAKREKTKENSFWTTSTLYINIF